MFTSQPRLLPAVLVVADVLDVLDHFGAQSMFPHDGQHLPVHQVMRTEAVGVTAVPSGEMFADVEPLTRWLLPTDLSPTFSLVTFTDLQRGDQEPETNHFLYLPGHSHHGKLDSMRISRGSRDRRKEKNAGVF